MEEKKKDVQEMLSNWENQNLHINKNIKVKKLVPEAKLPSKANNTDAGYDIISIDDGTIELVEIINNKMK